MKVILTERVKNLGNIGEIVNVSAGYARNYLIPFQYAMVADERNTKAIAAVQQRLEKKMNDQKKWAEELKSKLDAVTIEIEKRVGGNGKLFGAVTSSELALELGKLGFDVERKIIALDQPIKDLGEYEPKVRLFKGVDAKFRVIVKADPKQQEEVKRLAEERVRQRAEDEARKAREAEKAKEEAAKAAAAAEE